MYDDNFCDTLALLKHSCFGKKIFDQIIPVFTRWSVDEDETARRKKAGRMQLFMIIKMKQGAQKNKKGAGKKRKRSREQEGKL